MIDVLYALVALLATTVGAVAGLGGGVIIKPLLDLIGRDDAATIGVYSAVAVFAMCLVSIARQLQRGFRFDLRILVAISTGSVLGGLLGERLLAAATGSLDNATVTAIQAGALGITLLPVLAYTLRESSIRHHGLRRIGPVLAVGALLGAVSVFLGIGGGPLNIALLTWLFSFGLKDATVYSLATIFFSQIAKLALVGIAPGFGHYDLHHLPALVGAAVIGGLLGTALNRHLSEGTVRRVYVTLVCVLIGVSAYNVVTNLPGL